MAHEPVGFVVVHGLVVIGDAANNDGADGPKHLQHLRSGSSQPQWHNFTAVGGCICDEDTPRDAFEKLGQQQYSQGVSEIEDKDKTIQEHKPSNGGPSVSDPAGNGTCEEDADESANWSTALKR